MHRPQLPSIHHNISCDECACDAEEKEENAKRVLSTKRTQGKA